MGIIYRFISGLDDYSDERRRVVGGSVGVRGECLGLGGLTSYWIGWLGRWDWIERWFKVKREKLEQQKGHVDRYGVWLALFTWLPVVGDLFAIALGFYRVRPKMSAFYMLVGRFARFLVWVLLYIKYADRFIEWIS